VGIRGAGVNRYCGGGGCHAGEGAPLQRLFSTFPAGWPGAGLLVLRLAAGGAAVAAGVVCLGSDAGMALVRVVLGVVLAASGASLLAGFLTPFAATLVGSCAGALALSLIPAPSTTFADPAAGALVVLVAVAIALVGPGAYSLDSYLFGRREIVIAPGTLNRDTQP